MIAKYSTARYGEFLETERRKVVVFKAASWMEAKGHRLLANRAPWIWNAIRYRLIYPVARVLIGRENLRLLWDWQQNDRGVANTGPK